MSQVDISNFSWCAGELSLLDKSDWWINCTTMGADGTTDTHNISPTFDVESLNMTHICVWYNVTFHQYKCSILKWPIAIAAQVYMLHVRTCSFHGTI